MPPANEARIVELAAYPQQAAFIADPHRYVAFVGGRNAGKSYAGSVKAMLKAASLAGSGGGLGIVAAPTFPMLDGAARPQLVARLREAGMRTVERTSRGRLYIPSWNAEILFATLETESRVRGPNASWAWTDELDHLADPRVWLALKGAVRDGRHPQLWATSTPKGKRLLWTEWVSEAGTKPDHALHRATTYANIFSSLPADEFAAGLGYGGKFYEQEIEAKFVSFEGLVFDRFDREEHVTAVHTNGWRTVLGVDVGTRAPTAILTVAHAGDRRHVVREFYATGLGNAQIRAAINREAAQSRPDRIFVDPSAAGLILDLQLDGLPAQGATTDILFGIQVVASAFDSGLTIDPTCVHLIAELEGYAWPERTGGREIPVGGEDHAIDCLRYACVALHHPTVMRPVPDETFNMLDAWTMGELDVDPSPGPARPRLHR